MGQVQEGADAVGGFPFPLLRSGFVPSLGANCLAPRWALFAVNLNEREDAADKGTS